ncbi:hypothetical protein PFICI_13539 [Pestalotiopsis fici W106-1]|uniref:Uncharacterized protein n=1 Tax=Pestalotiopsis fici (strain W106-1 / CGMCC3.15140) TaxID=1229662 RepID=W3WMA5_PESFW|nr:uncharacterized protein PFICI_13539 [Pestalotiopsis fici W106-1]ETS75055.1 hypothetical protein PFICI_13539 [Pestalotiopsis fici W106-1]
MPCLRNVRSDNFDIDDIPEVPVNFARYLDNYIQTRMILMVERTDKTISKTKVANEMFRHTFQKSRNAFQGLETQVFVTIDIIKKVPELREDHRALIRRMYDQASKRCELQDESHEVYFNHHLDYIINLFSDTSSRKDYMVDTFIPMIDDFLDTIGEEDPYHAQIRGHRNTVRLLVRAVDAMLQQYGNLFFGKRQIVRPCIDDGENDDDDDETEQDPSNLHELLHQDEAARKSLEQKLDVLKMELFLAEARTSVEAKMAMLSMDVSGVEE